MRHVIGIAACALLAGCAGLAGDGAKIVEGTDLTLGVSLPYADASDAMTVVNFLTGFRVLVAENARAKVKYTSSATNDWFGIVTSRTEKRIEATVEPTVEPEAEEAGEEEVIPPRPSGALPLSQGESLRSTARRDASPHQGES